MKGSFNQRSGREPQSKRTTCNEKSMLGFKVHSPLLCHPKPLILRKRDSVRTHPTTCILTRNICTEAHLIGNEPEDMLL